jgi:hypothetical protein
MYTDDMSKTLSSILMKCLKPLIYTDEMSKTLSSRIAEAHAKMMMRQPLQVEADDAIVGNNR